MEPTFKLTTPAIESPVKINPVAEPVDAKPADISFDELQTMVAPPVADVSFDELSALAEPETTATGFSVGQATQPVAYPEKPPVDIGLGTELWRHFTGRDIEGKDFEDPNLWMRLTSMIGLSIVGGKAGAVGMTAMGQPELAPVGMALGGAAGTVAGVFYPEKMNEFLAARGFYDGGKAPAGLSPHQLLRYARNELLIGAAIGTTIRGTGMTARLLTRKLMPISQTDQALADAAHEMNIMLSRVQFMDESKGGVGSAIAAAVPAFGVFPVLFGPGRKALDFSADSLARASKTMPALAGEPTSMSELAVEAYRKGRNVYHELDATYKTKWDALRREADKTGAAFWVHNTVAEYDRTMAKLSKESVRYDGIIEDGITAPQNGRVLDEVRSNLQKFIGNLPGIDQNGVRYVRQRPYEQLETIRQIIRQDIAKYEGKDHAFAAGIYSKFLEAINADLLTAPANSAAYDIGTKAVALSREQGQVFSQYLDTAMAKTWSRFNQGGIRAKFDTPTSLPVDMLAKAVVNKISDSPQSVDELVKLMGAGSDTMKKFTYHTMREVVEQSQIQNKVGEVVLDPGLFRAKLGLGNFESNKKLIVEKLLKESGSPLTMANMETLAGAAEKVGQVELGKTSTFLKRAAGLNAVKGIAAAVLPGAASYGVTGDFVTGTLLWASSIGMSRAFSAMITEPVAAKALQTLMAENVSDAVKITAFTQVLRQTAITLRNDPEGIRAKTATAWQKTQETLNDIEMFTEGYIATFTDALKGRK